MPYTNFVYYGQKVKKKTEKRIQIDPHHKLLQGTLKIKSQVHSISHDLNINITMASYVLCLCL
jgi:hypothetical protein